MCKIWMQRVELYFVPGDNVCHRLNMYCYLVPDRCRFSCDICSSTDSYEWNQCYEDGITLIDIMVYLMQSVQIRNWISMYNPCNVETTCIIEQLFLRHFILNSTFNDSYASTSWTMFCDRLYSGSFSRLSTSRRDVRRQLFAANRSVNRIYHPIAYVHWR